MQELTTNPKTHVILTWKDGEYFITEKQHQIVLSIGLNDKITIDGSTIFGKSISEIITIEEKYKRDENVKTSHEVDFYKNYTGVDETLRTFTPSRRKKALESMRKGFMKNFKNNEMSYSAQLVLKNMDYRIGTAEW